MTFTPSPKLRAWLDVAGRKDATVTLTPVQVALVAGLRDQAATFKHFDEETREAWVLWTAMTHTNTRPRHVHWHVAALRGKHYEVWFRWLVEIGLLTALLTRHWR